MSSWLWVFGIRNTTYQSPVRIIWNRIQISSLYLFSWWCYCNVPPQDTIPTKIPKYHGWMLFCTTKYIYSSGQWNNKITALNLSCPSKKLWNYSQFFPWTLNKVFHKPNSLSIPVADFFFFPHFLQFCDPNQGFIL